MATFIDFKYGVQATYDDLKNDNNIDNDAIYFLYDTKKLYKGDKLIASTDVEIMDELPSIKDALLDTIYIIAKNDKALMYILNKEQDGFIEITNSSIDDIDKHLEEIEDKLNNMMPIYEMSDEEFWNQYNSGQLQSGMYNVEGNTLGMETFRDDVPITDMSLILEKDDICYIATYTDPTSHSGDGKSILSVLHKDGSLLGQYTLSDMLKKSDKPWEFVSQTYAGFNRSFIGIDNDGYLYIDLYCKDSFSKPIGYSTRVLSINTEDISNPDNWKLVTNSENNTFYGNLAFSTINILAFNSSEDISLEEYRQSDNFRVSDGGTFAFEVNPTYEYISNIHCDPYEYITGSDSGKRTTYAYYLKKGKITYFYNPYSSLKEFVGGPMCWSVDPVNNKFYGLVYANDIGDESENSICAAEMSIDGSIKIFRTYFDNDDFYDIRYACASFVKYKNNCLFYQISNKNYTYQRYIDLSTEDISHTNLIHSSMQDKNRCFNSFMVDTGETISYLYNTYIEDKGYKTYLISWNYKSLNISSSEIDRSLYNDECGLNSIPVIHENIGLFYSKSLGENIEVKGISLNTLEPLFSVTTKTNSDLFNGIQILKDDTFVISSYSSGDDNYRKTIKVSDSEDIIELDLNKDIHYVLNTNLIVENNYILLPSRKSYYTQNYCYKEINNKTIKCILIKNNISNYKCLCIRPIFNKPVICSYYSQYNILENRIEEMRLKDLMVQQYKSYKYVPNAKYIETYIITKKGQLIKIKCE